MLNHLNKYPKWAIVPLVFIGLFLFIAWVRPSFSPQEYIRLVEQGQQGLGQEKTFEETSFHMSMRPPTYLALQELDGKKPSRAAWSEHVDTYAGSSHYILRMENNAGGELLKSWATDLENYQYLVNYLAFEVKHDLKLMGQKDTFDCQFVHFERNFDLAPFAQLQIGFDVPPELNPVLHDESWTVQFNAEQLGLGPLNFRFEHSKLVSHPNISF